MHRAESHAKPQRVGQRPGKEFLSDIRGIRGESCPVVRVTGLRLCVRHLPGCPGYGLRKHPYYPVQPSQVDDNPFTVGVKRVKL